MDIFYFQIYHYFILKNLLKVTNPNLNTFRFKLENCSYKICNAIKEGEDSLAKAHRLKPLN